MLKIYDASLRDRKATISVGFCVQTIIALYFIEQTVDGIIIFEPS